MKSNKNKLLSSNKGINKLGKIKMTLRLFQYRKCQVVARRVERTRECTTQMTF